MGSLQDFSTQQGLFICVSDIVLPKSINCKAPWNTNYSYYQKCLQVHMPCREDHAHEEEEEKQTRFFNLTHELNVWKKHKFQEFMFVCKTQKVTIMLESRQQWPCTGRGRWLKALEVKTAMNSAEHIPLVSKAFDPQTWIHCGGPLVVAAHSSQSVFFRNKAEEWFCEITMVYTPIRVKFSRHLCKLTVGE